LVRSKLRRADGGFCTTYGRTVASKQKRAPRGGEVPPPVERTASRRALSHVGGRVTYRGRPELRTLLEHALAVNADERRTRAHIHGFHSYPARLHPDTAAALIDGLSKPGETILDPFCGSGTVLLEARLQGRLALGRDVNPLAVALAKLKTGGSSLAQRTAVAEEAATVTQEAETRRAHKNPPSERYPKEDLELFEIHVLLELDSLRTGIRAVKDRATRRILLLTLSSILTKVSRRHGDSSRKRSERRLPSGYTIRMFEDRATELCRQLEAFEELLPAKSKAPDVRDDDARTLKSVAAGSVELVLTSPPYPGVYDYYDHHAARLRWLGMDSADFRRGEIGSRRQLNRLTPETAVQRWEEDFTRVLRAVSRVLKVDRFAAFVVADTAVSGAVVRGDVTTARLAEQVGFECAAVASQLRPQFHAESSRTFGGSARMEHVIVLQRR
jgi:hypothetical protein